MFRRKRKQREESKNPEKSKENRAQIREIKRNPLNFEERNCMVEEKMGVP